MFNHSVFSADDKIKFTVDVYSDGSLHFYCSPFFAMRMFSEFFKYLSVEEKEVFINAAENEKSS